VAQPGDVVYSLTLEPMGMQIGGRHFTRKEAERRIGSLAQLGGTRRVELAEGRAKGVAAIEFHTGSGLEFTVLPDRGLDIPFCTYKGVNLVFLAPGGVAHPAFHDPAGFEWLRTFFGGLLTTCGLTYFGDPGRDGEEELGLHGRYAALPATQVCDLSRWDGDEFLLEVTGTVTEAALFGDKLRLERSVRSRIGDRSLTVRDRVQNVGYRDSPFTILYHLNAGFPLLDGACVLESTSTAAEAYDAAAEAALPEAASFQPPDPAFPSMGLDYLHTMAADGQGFAWAALINPELAAGAHAAGPAGPAGPGGQAGPVGLGLYLKFRADTLPFLNEWKYLAEGDYVVGIEPANTKIVNRATLRRSGRLPSLRPGETREMEVEIGVLEGPEEIEAFRRRCQGIRAGGPAR